MRVVVCGEALIDLIPGAEARAGQHAQTDMWQAVCGGSPMNAAVALARLGTDVSFLGRMGNDLFADQLIAHLDRSGVGTDLVVKVDEPTSLAIVNPQPDGVNNYVFHLRDTANFGWQLSEFPKLGDDDWLHFGSLTPIVAPGSEALARWVRSLDNPMSIDVNVRPSVLGDRTEYWQIIEPLLAAVGDRHGVVKLSIEDLDWLVDGVADEAEALDIAAQWAVDYGLSLVVMTLGSDGAAAVKPDGRVERTTGHRVDVVDTVGAGDTFMAGFLSSWLDNPGDLGAALELGSAASALVCTRTGANPPTLAEVEDFLAGRA